MFFHLLYPLKHYFTIFNVFGYVTFRATMAAITAFLIAVFMGPRVIRFLLQAKIKERVDKTDAERLKELQKDKKNVPTMGGVIIIVPLVVATLLWANPFKLGVALAILTVVSLGALGACDDYVKLTQEHSKGLAGRAKLLFQLGLGLICGILLYRHLKDVQDGTSLIFPFFKTLRPNMGLLFIPLVMIVITATSNAVNLTDGLDGLAIGCTIMAAFAYMVITYLVGRVDLSSYLLVPYVPGASELSVFCAALIGAGLGFLWFNCYPAQIFMGDTGALAIGGALGLVAVAAKQELMLFFVGGIFVIEALSVLLQVGYFKLTGGKRIFACAPLHHHFQLQGWSETKVTVRFWILAALMAVFSLATLKLR